MCFFLLCYLGVPLRAAMMGHPVGPVGDLLMLPAEGTVSNNLLINRAGKLLHRARYKYFEFCHTGSLLLFLFPFKNVGTILSSWC